MEINVRSIAILLAFALLNSGYSGIHTNLNRIEK